MKRYTPELLYISVAAVATLVLSYAKGNEGYEAFISTSIALWIFVTWLTLRVVRLIFARKQWWLIGKLLAALGMIGMWCMVAIAIMIVVTHQGADPRITVPHVHWLIVLLGVAGYLVPRFFTHQSKTPTRKIAFGWLAAIFAIVTLFLAGNAYYDSSSHFRSIILVLALQLQYIMCFVVVKTDYIAWAEQKAKRINTFTYLQVQKHPENEIYAPVLLVGLPIFLPLLVVLAMTLVRSQ